ncbi:hypothetical protein AHAS_Ahas19G0096800 [Arachis hypogaea]
MVVVSKDENENFTTINAAIPAAPNNTASNDGYFLVFIKKGVYEEYVSIAKNKKQLMLVGDGINQTIITGDRNVVDGSTIILFLPTLSLCLFLRREKDEEY